MLDRIRGHDLPPMLRRKAVIGERVGTAVLENRDCSCSASAVLRDDRSKSLLSKVAIRLRKDALEVDSKRLFLPVRDVCENIAHEVDLEPLPRGARKLRCDRRLQSGVYVANDETNAVEPTVLKSS